MEVVYFLNPLGKVLKDSSIRTILIGMSKPDKKFFHSKKNICYRTGPSVNTPSKLLKELQGLKVPWEIVVVEENKIHLLNNDERNKFLKKLSVSDDNMLTGEIALQFI